MNCFSYANILNHNSFPGMPFPNDYTNLLFEFQNWKSEYTLKGGGQFEMKCYSK